jgi:hypothetical protein
MICGGVRIGTARQGSGQPTEFFGSSAAAPNACQRIALTHASGRMRETKRTTL